MNPLTFDLLRALGATVTLVVLVVAFTKLIGDDEP